MTTDCWHRYHGLDGGLGGGAGGEGGLGGEGDVGGAGGGAGEGGGAGGGLGKQAPSMPRQTIAQSMPHEEEHVRFEPGCRKKEVIVEEGS